MTVRTPVDTPPGWYADPTPPPERPDQLRWWDGQAWTTHVHGGTPVSHAAAPTEAAGPPMGYGNPGTGAVDGRTTEPPAARGVGRIIAVVAVVALVVLGGVAAAVVVFLGGGAGAGAQAPYDGEPVAIPTTPYELMVPDEWDHVTDTSELIFGQLGVSYEGPTFEGPYSVVLAMTQADTDLFVPPASDDPETVARSNAEDFLGYFFPVATDMFSGELEDDVQTVTSEEVRQAGEDGYRITLTHEPSDAVIDVLAIGGDDPLLLVAAVEATSVDATIEEVAGQILESLGRS